MEGAAGSSRLPRIGMTFAPLEVRPYQELARSGLTGSLDLLGIPDSQAGRYLECYALAAFAAASGVQARIGPLVSNAATRHPLVSAAAVATVDECAPGGAFFGLGTGDSSLEAAGLRPTSLADLREYLLAVRGLLHEGTAEFGGRTLRIAGRSDPPPILLAANGPRTIELAGEVADGIIVGAGLTASVVDQALAHADAGARRRGRSLEDLQVWFVARTAIGPDRTTAERRLIATLALTGRHVFRAGDRALGYPVDGRARASLMTLVRRADVAHKGIVEGNPNAELVDELDLDGFLLDRFAVAGTHEDVLLRLVELRARGIERVIIRTEAAMAVETLEAISCG